MDSKQKTYEGMEISDIISEEAMNYLESVENNLNVEAVRKLKGGKVEIDLQRKTDPTNQDWHFSITCTPSGDDRKVQYEDLHDGFYELWNDYDVDEEVEMWVQAKENDTDGHLHIPSVRQLVRNEEWKEDFLERCARETYR